MDFNCVCMQQLEGRTLLAAGVVDNTYTPPFNGEYYVDYPPDIIRPQVDGKTIHFGGVGVYGEKLWRQNPNGSLDTSFGENGLVVLNDVVDLDIARDGKIVLGVWNDDGNSPQILRYTVNGTPDPTFGTNGVARLPVIGIDEVVALPDGKILAAGEADGGVRIYRLNSNGSLDTSFGSGGVARLAGPGGSKYIEMFAMELRPTDNRIVLAGGIRDNIASNPDQWMVVVLAPNGVKEWQGGLPIANVTDTEAHTLAVDSDGSIVVGGNAVFSDGVQRGIVARYPAPNSSTPFAYANIGTNYPLSEIALQPDGKAVLGAWTSVWRLNYNMTLDSSFGSGGHTELGVFATAVGLQGDGQILMHGWGSRNQNFRQVRLTGDTTPASRGADGTLNVAGSTRNDRIFASTASGLLTVNNSGSRPFYFSPASIKKISVNAGDGNDLVTLSGALPGSVLNGGNGNDSLTGADGADTLDGNFGNDILKGGNNRDTVTYAGRGSALLLSIDNAANDGHTGEFDNINSDIETLIGGNANDRITGSDATNALYGGPGNDVLIGKAGNDLLGGQDGNDTMDGGAGSDGFFGNTGIDTADYSNRWDALVITQDEQSNDGKAGELDNVHRDVEVIRGGNLADKITAWDINNTLYGNGGNDTLIGGGGNDAIYGGGGNDQLTGSGGADSLFGDDGDDTIFARDGVADLLLNGGNGFDSAQVDSVDRNKTSIERNL